MTINFFIEQEVLLYVCGRQGRYVGRRSNSFAYSFRRFFPRLSTFTLERAARMVSNIVYVQLCNAMMSPREPSVGRQVCIELKVDRYPLCTIY